MSDEEKEFIKGKDTYTAEQITVLEGLAPVRKRPGMYIGGTGIEGLHHLIWEVVDNGIDEAMAGFATEVIVELQKDNRVLIVDNGRGIPIDIHKQTKKSALETVLTTLHAGGKFGEGSYKVSGGLHGVGVSVVNALSKFMRAEVKRDNKVHTQEYALGKTKTKLELTDKFNPYFESIKTGTAIIFEPDDTIFETTVFSLKTIIDHLRQQAYLTKNIQIRIIDSREEDAKHYNFYFEGGISAYVRHLNKNKTALNEPPIYVEKTVGELLVEVAVQYADDYNEHIYTFANNIYTPEGGSHLTGFRSAITRAINDYGKKSEFFKNGEVGLVGDDTREGLTAVISVKLPDPQFEGQTKAKLGNPEVRTVVENVASLGITTYLEEHPNESRKILEKIVLSARARLAAKAARETVIRKGALEGMTLPGKLADCSSRRPEESELYLVEGDSAGGCFSGDTKIALTDGRSLSFKELLLESKSGKINYCYTIKKDGHIGIEKILSPRITKKNAEVVKITLDNKEKITCTPDHKFMLRDGTYLEAKNLKPNISLMPLRKKLSGGKKEKLLEAVKNYNHRIKKIEFIKEKMNVYDIEVPNTHNFALASGVFVHNSAKQGRDRKFQAILPLRGKILNVERARLDRMLASEEIKNFIVAMGAGVADSWNVEKIRYHRIIIMTDADVDGSHIRTLLLTLIYRHFREVIDKGYLYIAQPPLYSINVGKNKKYFYNDEAKDGYIKIQKAGEKLNIQRYKGLGEMNPDQLWETTMNPENRVLKQVTIEDVERADEIFTMLMGDEVPPRKKFIQTQAKNVKNLDI